MKSVDVKAMAKKLGISSTKISREDLIRSIQVKEGNFPCFKTAAEYCDQMECCWRAECMPKN